MPSAGKEASNNAKILHQTHSDVQRQLRRNKKQWVTFSLEVGVDRHNTQTTTVEDTKEDDKTIRADHKSGVHKIKKRPTKTMLQLWKNVWTKLTLRMPGKRQNPCKVRNTLSANVI